MGTRRPALLARRPRCFGRRSLGAVQSLPAHGLPRKDYGCRVASEVQDRACTPRWVHRRASLCISTPPAWPLPLLLGTRTPCFSLLGEISLARSSLCPPLVCFFMTSAYGRPRNGFAGTTTERVAHPIGHLSQRRKEIGIPDVGLCSHAYNLSFRTAQPTMPVLCAEISQRGLFRTMVLLCHPPPPGESL